MIKTIVGLLFPVMLMSQNLIIKDSLSGLPIPYVAVYSTDTKVGVTSDKLGQFSIADSVDYDALSFYNPGYRSKTIKKEDVTYPIYLYPEEQAPIPVASERLHKREIRTGKVENTSFLDKKSYSSNAPIIFAKYFPYKKKYEFMPYLNKIFINLIANGSDRIYSLHIFEVNADGSPGRDVFTDQLILTARGGDKSVEVDFSGRAIRFPENGYFIGLGSIIIEQNKFEFQQECDCPEEVETITSYYPMFAGKTVRKGNLWGWRYGKWTDLSISKKSTTKYGNSWSANTLLVEIELSN